MPCSSINILITLCHTLRPTTQRLWTLNVAILSYYLLTLTNRYSKVMIIRPVNEIIEGNNVLWDLVFMPAVSHSWNFWQIWENLNFTEELYFDMTTVYTHMKYGQYCDIFLASRSNANFCAPPPPPEKIEKEKKMKEEKEKNPHISLHSTWMPYTKRSMWDWIIIPKLLFA